MTVVISALPVFGLVTKNDTLDVFITGRYLRLAIFTNRVWTN